MKEKRILFLPAALLLLLGILYRPVRVCFFLAAGILLVIWLFDILRRKGARALSGILSVLLVLGCAASAVIEYRIVRYGRTDESRSPSAIVILGAGVEGDRPSLTLASRLDAAIAYLADRPTIPVIVSGGKGTDERISEAACMRAYLIQRGVEPGRIVEEDRSSNTRENVENSKKILRSLGIGASEDIAVVTSNYHLYRTSLYWDAPTMIPVAADMPGIYRALNVNYYLREALGVVKFLLCEG